MRAFMPHDLTTLECQSHSGVLRNGSSDETILSFTKSPTAHSAYCMRHIKSFSFSDYSEKHSCQIQEKRPQLRKHQHFVGYFGIPTRNDKLCQYADNSSETSTRRGMEDNTWKLTFL